MAEASLMLTCYHPAHVEWYTGARDMALSMEREMGIHGCADPGSRFLPGSGKASLRIWATIRTAIVLGIGLMLSQAGWAQDPLNDVHINPPAPAPAAPA